MHALRARDVYLAEPHVAYALVPMEFIALKVNGYFCLHHVQSVADFLYRLVFFFVS